MTAEVPRLCFLSSENPGRLTHDKRIKSTGVELIDYAWDAAGNRTSITKDGVTTISTYDVGDKLASVGSVTPIYDGFGGIIDDGAGFGIPRGADGAEIGVDAISGGTVSPLYTFWRNAGGEPVATEDADGLHREVWGNPGADLPLAGDGPEGNWLWIAADGLVLGQLRDGVVLGAANDPSGSIAYFDGALAGVPGAFGEGAGLSDERHAWTGMETLPGTPYQLAQHRLYDTANGRFTVNDPIGLAGGDHRYAYAGGDPVQFVDPSGLSFAAPSSSSPASHASGDGLHSKQLFDSMYTGMGEDSGYDEWHDYGTYEDFFSARVLHDEGGSYVSPAPDECQGMGCMPSEGEPGDEQDGTGIFSRAVPVLAEDGDEDQGADVDVYGERPEDPPVTSRQQAKAERDGPTIWERLRHVGYVLQYWVVGGIPVGDHAGGAGSPREGAGALRPPTFADSGFLHRATSPLENARFLADAAMAPYRNWRDNVASRTARSVRQTTESAQRRYGRESAYRDIDVPGGFSVVDDQRNAREEQQNSVLAADGIDLVAAAALTEGIGALAEGAAASRGGITVYKSIRESGGVVDGFTAVRGGLTKNTVNNLEKLEQLRAVEPGKWSKVYKDGFDGAGNKVSVHYFESASGAVTGVKTKVGWSNAP